MKLAIALSACASIMLTTALCYSLTLLRVCKRACTRPCMHSFRIIFLIPLDFTCKWVDVCTAVGVARVLCLYSFLGVFLALCKFVCVCVCARACARAQ